jgi:RNA polymerase sigma-70 factor (ECF subfamily)
MELSLNQSDVFRIGLLKDNKLSLEERSFLQLQYSIYYKKICLFIQSKGFKKDEVEILASNVFMKVIENISSFKDRGNTFGSWVYKIASNEVAQCYREIKKNKFEDINDSVFIIAENQHDLDYNYELLQKALKNLNKKNLLIIHLRYFEKLSFREIAELLKINESNAKVRCFRAIEKLRNIYNRLNE